MSCKINTSDQCFINKKMSYFTFLCGPLSPGCMMECQIILWPSTYGRVIECACASSGPAASETRHRVDTSTRGKAVTNYFGEHFQRQPLTWFLEAGAFVFPALSQTC